MDRETKYSGVFRKLIGDVGVNCVRLPPKSPNLNSYLERFTRHHISEVNVDLHVDPGVAKKYRQAYTLWLSQCG